jgi:16S rRNA processing protein RimM
VTAPPSWVVVGRIARAHGVKGELAVLPLTQVPERFDPGSRLYVGEDEGRAFTVSSSRPHHKMLLVVFDEVKDRTQAEGLRGELLFVPAYSMPTLPAGEYWPHELIGCEVVTEAGRALGSIREVVHTQGNDVWVAKADAEEVLIPALKDVVLEVDVAGRRVVVREIPGLTAP